MNMKQKGASNPATKNDTENRLDRIEHRLNLIDKNIDVSEKLIRMDIRLNIKDATEQIEKTITKFKDLILTTVDPLLKELEERREDRDLAVHQTASFQEKVEDHEKRIKHLEKVQQAT